ncbi:MAG TPA: hypothetical protein PKA50_06685 [Gemmatimonadales bacterium]|nr:hypothetical protein [Gemmatimonadales bacterium]
MLVPRRTCGLAAVTLLAACAQEPVAPTLASPAVSAALASPAAAPPCTKRWKAAVSGDWSVAANWTPAGVPRAGSVVCLDVLGKAPYVVTLSTDATVAVLRVGGGLTAAKATLTFTPAGAGRTLTVTGDAQVAVGGTLRMATNGFDGTLIADALVIDGTFRSTAALPLTSNHITADSLVNRGLFAVDTVIVGNYVTLTGPMALRNSGQFQLAAGFAVIPTAPAAAVYLEGGGVSGISSLAFGAGGGAVVDVWWTGTTFTGTQLQVNSGTLHLGNTLLQGSVTLDPLSGQVTLSGNIGPGVDVWVPSWGGTRTLQLEAPGGGVLRNEGTLGIYVQAETLEVKGASLANVGMLRLTGRPARFDLDSLTNTGTIDAKGGTLQYVRNTGVLRNAGTIDAGNSSPGVIMDGAEFMSEASGVQTGELLAENATISGTGVMGEVTLVSATLEPGAPVGTLTATSLTMDPASGMIFDVAGVSAGSFDVLDVAGQVTLAGSFTLREVAPFTGGSCGQALPLILDQSPLPRGAFTKLFGLSPGLGRGYRLYAPTGVTYLVGYNPIPLVSLAPAALAVAEGGPAASYAICLQHLPTANVTVTAASALGQLQAMTPATFTPADWGLPRSVSVVATNDLVLEPAVQADEITHTVTSTDPLYGPAGLSDVAVSVTDNDGSANLELSVTSAPPSVPSGASFTLAFRVGNTGPDASVGSTFSMPASAGYHYVSATGVLGCSGDPVTGIRCDLPGVASGGAFFTFGVTLGADTPGSYPTTYSLTSIQADPAPANNSRVQTITVQ